MIHDIIKQKINCKKYNKSITKYIQLFKLQWKEKLVDFHKNMQRLPIPKEKSLKGLDVHTHRWINCHEYKMSTLFQDCNTKDIEQNLLSLNTKRSMKASISART